ncbi:MAG: D-alanine--D-alanine ligase [Oscillospiraceae bacterium]|nr:D-alanine--D-alanine ligase [Oscillospiraceae bacterium]
MKIVVLAGGLSPERDVSLSSGSLIANALIETGHRVMLLDLYKGIDLPGDLDDLFTDVDSPHRYQYTVPAMEPDLTQLKAEADMGDVLMGKNVLDLCRSADLVFIALHGDIGENGKLQAVFDVYGIRYTGTGYAGSLLAMDKDLSKQIMKNHGIPTPEWMLFHCETDDPAQVEDQIGFPCIVKPCNGGSSIGVSIVADRAGFDLAIRAAQKYEGAVVVEKLIAGREFSVGILDGTALSVIEIIPNEGFFDYINKYQAGRTQEICPADLHSEVSARMQAVAVQVHEALRLKDYSRIDFMLDGADNIFCLEANTLPGMTPTSLLPQEALVSGISYNELCNKIAEMALR